MLLEPSVKSRREMNIFYLKFSTPRIFIFAVFYDKLLNQLSISAEVFGIILQRTTKKIYQALCQNEEFKGFEITER